MKAKHITMLKSEMALAQARIAESKLKYASGERVPAKDVHEMNLKASILRARHEHLKVIYQRRSQQRAASDHERLMRQVMELKDENARLRAEIEGIKP